MKRIQFSLALVAAGIVALLALTACSVEHGNAAVAERDQTPSQEQPPPAVVTVRPAPDATGVQPRDRVGVTVADGTIETVALTNPAGEHVNGRLSEDRASWVVAEPLGYGKTYTWSGSAVGADNKPVRIAGSFTTVSPNGTIGARLNVGDGKTYGVAMPIAVTFDAPVEDKAAVEKSLTVRTSVPTEGAWAWLDDYRAHWRPKEYWQPGTEVSLRAMIYGVNFGGGVYGRADLTAKFSIGRAQIVKANTNTHRVVVLRNGKRIANFPASFGLESDPGRVTRSGVHVVMSKHSTYSMSNPRYDYENVVVPWAVRISNNGEFIHGYAPSIWAQGSRNVSHGCVNLSPGNAKIYYDSVLVGDPVEVVGSSQQLSAVDGDYYDWTYTWSQWTAMSAA